MENSKNIMEVTMLNSYITTQLLEMGDQDGPTKLDGAIRNLSHQIHQYMKIDRHQAKTREIERAEKRQTEVKGEDTGGKQKRENQIENSREETRR